MAEDTALVEKRDEFKRQLTVGEYVTLLELILDGTGRLIQRLLRRQTPVSDWFSALLISILLVLVNSLIAFALGATYALDSEGILLQVWNAGLCFSILIFAKKVNHLIHDTLRESTLGAIESTADLDDLHRRFSAFYDLRKQWLAGLASGVVLGLYSPVVVASIKDWPSGVGLTALSAITFFLAGIGCYYASLIFGLPNWLSRYQFKLYTADPSSSEVIQRLSDMMDSILFRVALVFVVFTLGLIYFELLTSQTANLFLAVAMWGPLVAIFLSSQQAWRTIITRAKWQTLNEIQAKIEAIKAAQNIAEEETMETVNRLMDYHDRIKAKRNTALDVRGGLNFINSLLLPLLGFVVGNIDKVLALFS